MYPDGDIYKKNLHSWTKAGFCKVISYYVYIVEGLSMLGGLNCLSMPRVYRRGGGPLLKRTSLDYLDAVLELESNVRGLHELKASSFSYGGPHSSNSSPAIT